MTYDVIQSNSNTASSSGSSISVSLTPTPGNLLILVGACQSPNPPSTITFPAGFTTNEEVFSGGGPGVLAIASRIVPSSPPSSYGISYATSSDQGIMAVELGPGVADANTSVREVGATMSAPSITPTAGSDAILFVVGWYGAAYAVTSLTGTYTKFIDHFLSAGSDRFFIAKRLVNPASGSYSASYQAEGNSVIANTIHASYRFAPPSRAQGLVIF